MRFGETLATGGLAYVCWQAVNFILSKPLDAGMLATGAAMLIVGIIVMVALPRSEGAEE